MSWADLLHGPITAVPPGSSCLLLPDRESLSGSYRTIRARLEEAGAELLEGPSVRAEGIAEPLLPLLDAVALQRPVLRAARRRGLDPDRPLGLTKVTQT
jgi:glucosamine--fructose-6-phosphate aminotransferase (isomerizing)